MTIIYCFSARNRNANLRRIRAKSSAHPLPVHPAPREPGRRREELARAHHLEEDLVEGDVPVAPDLAAGLVEPELVRALEDVARRDAHVLLPRGRAVLRVEVAPLLEVGRRRCASPRGSATSRDLEVGGSEGANVQNSGGML